MLRRENRFVQLHFCASSTLATETDHWKTKVSTHHKERDYVEMYQNPTQTIHRKV